MLSGGRGGIASAVSSSSDGGCCLSSALSVSPVGTWSGEGEVGGREEVSEATWSSVK